jgi:hypothetical protein
MFVVWDDTVWNVIFMLLFNFVNCVFLLLCLWILIVVFTYYCYVCPVYSVSLCCSVYCLCVNVYCTTATGCQPNCSQQIYHIIYHIISYHIYISSYRMFLRRPRLFRIALSRLSRDVLYMYVSLHVKCLLFLSYFNRKWNVSTFRKNFRYKMLRKCV